MSLVYSCTLQPQGAANLAAVRFAAPVRVSRLRIFPSGMPMFANAPHIISQTAPGAFVVDLFFNVQPVRHRATNALVPTSIAYPGGLLDFAVDMSQYATRLMILKGSFVHLSLAIYGQFISDHPPTLTYQPRPIVLSSPEPLSTHLDPAHAHEPTALATSFLAIIPNPPSLSLAIRLMFCLKPTEDDWNNPLFPHIFADLDNDSEDYDLYSIVSILDRPIPEDVSKDSLHRFVERLSDFLGPPSTDQAYQIAHVLNRSASQSPLLSQALLNAFDDFSTIFTPSTLADTSTLVSLTDACSNSLIAQHFLTKTQILTTLAQTRDNPRSSSDRVLISTIDRLTNRLHGSQAFQDALFNNNEPDFLSAAAWVYDISKEEQPLGNWVNSMIMHRDNILANLPDTPPESTPPLLFARDLDDPIDSDTPVTHNEFITFVRAFVGVVSLLGVLAWADSVGNEGCRERTLAVINLWQNVDGYREIVNHLFLLRQLTRRLKWITTDNETPRYSGLLAERVLCSLLLPPVSTTTTTSSLPLLPAVNADLTQTVLSLAQPLAFIPEHERLGFRKLALVVDDGLPAAIEELAAVFNHGQQQRGSNRKPLSSRRVRILRVGVGLVLRELCLREGGGGGGGDEEDGEGEGEWRILNAFGEEGIFGFVERLVDLFGDLVGDLIFHLNAGNVDLNLDFGSGGSISTTATTDMTGTGAENMKFQSFYSLPSSSISSNTNHQDLIEQLFATTRELLILIHHLVPVFSITAHGMRKIVVGIVDLVGCSDYVLEPSTTTTRKRTRKTMLERVSYKTRKTCVRVLRAFSEEEELKGAVESRGKRGCIKEVVLRCLLMVGQGVCRSGGEEERVEKKDEDEDEMVVADEEPQEGGKEDERRWKRNSEDPVKKVERVLELVECILPLNSSSGCGTDEELVSQWKQVKAYWAKNVFPLVIYELRLFMRVLSVEQKVRLVLILGEVDEEGEVGVGEWLVEEEVKEVGEVVKGQVGMVGQSDESDNDDEGVEETKEEVDGQKLKSQTVEGESMEGVETEGQNQVEGGKGEEEERRSKWEWRRERNRQREVYRAERTVNQYRIFTGLQFLWLLVSSSSTATTTTTEASSLSWFFNALVQTPTLSTHFTSLLTLLLEAHLTTPSLTSLFKFLSQPHHFEKLDSEALRAVVLLGVLRIVQEDVTSDYAGYCVLDKMVKDEGLNRLFFGGQQQEADALRLEVGRLCAVCGEHVDMVSSEVAQMVIGLLQWMAEPQTLSPDAKEGEGDMGQVKFVLSLRGITREAFGALCDSFVIMFPERDGIVEDIRSRMEIDEESKDSFPIPNELPDSLVLSLSDIASLFAKSRQVESSQSGRSGATTIIGAGGSLPRGGVGVGFDGGSSGTHIDGSGNGGARPSTPKGTKTPDILGTIISPPTALLRSPAATGLTKTYVNNDFRSLRQVPNARLNTSRLPSMHVDDFESGVGIGVPGASQASTSPLIVPVPIPLDSVSAFGGLLNMG